jgi:hypothetical protein
MRKDTDEFDFWNGDLTLDTELTLNSGQFLSVKIAQIFYKFAE